MSNYHNNTYYGYESKRADKYSRNNYNFENHEIYINNTDYNNLIASQKLSTDIRIEGIMKEFVTKFESTCDEWGKTTIEKVQTEEYFIVSVDPRGIYEIIDEINDISLESYHLFVKVKDNDTLIQSTHKLISDPETPYLKLRSFEQLSLLKASNLVSEKVHA